jgi:hypothetical protein
MRKLADEISFENRKSVIFADWKRFGENGLPLLHRLKMSITCGT